MSSCYQWLAHFKQFVLLCEKYPARSHAYVCFSGFLVVNITPVFFFFLFFGWGEVGGCFLSSMEAYTRGHVVKEINVAVF